MNTREESSVENRLPFWQKITYAAGQMGGALMPMITISWLLYYYTGRTDAAGNRIMLVSYSAFAVVNIISRVIDAAAAPLIGFASDRYNTRWGRRKPWVFIGAPFLSLSAVLLFYPPGEPGSGSNIVWLLCMLTALWIFFTAVVAPYISLLPEITGSNRERIEISSYMGVFEVAGTLMATIAVGLFIKVFPHGFHRGFVDFSDGYRFAVVVFSIIALFLFWLSVSFVREKPHSPAKDIPFGLIESVRQCLKNRPFLIFMVTLMMFSIALDELIAMIPFMVTLIMGFGAHVGGYIQGGLVVASLPMFFLVFRYSSRYGKKKVFGISFLMFALALPVIALMKDFPFIGWGVNCLFIAAGWGPLEEGVIVLVHALVPMVLFIFPLASFFVLIRPIFADLIDLDEKYTGYRREAMYDGLMGLVIKVAAGVASVIGPLCLKYFGGTVENPGGIQVVFLICTGMLLGAYALFRKYPLED